MKAQPAALLCDASREPTLHVHLYVREQVVITRYQMLATISIWKS